jgi:hypothetical protein
LTIGFKRDAAAKIIKDEGLVRFCKTKFPGHSGVLDAGQWRGAGTTVIATDQNHIRVSLCNTRRDRAHTHLGYEFYTDSCTVVRRLQIVD